MTTKIHCHGPCIFNDYGVCARDEITMSEAKSRCYNRNYNKSVRKEKCQVCGRQIMIWYQRKIGLKMEHDAGVRRRPGRLPKMLEPAAPEIDPVGVAQVPEPEKIPVPGLQRREVLSAIQDQLGPVIKENTSLKSKIEQLQDRLDRIKLLSGGKI